MRVLDGEWAALIALGGDGSFGIFEGDEGLNGL
jgi:hypothetical protein